MTFVRAQVKDCWYYLVIDPEGDYMMYPALDIAYGFDSAGEAAAWIEEHKEEPVIDIMELQVYTLEAEKLS